MLNLFHQYVKERRSSNFQRASNLVPDSFSATDYLQSHIFISLRLPCGTSVNEATNALYRHPVLRQMSVSIESAVTVAESKRWVFVHEREGLRIIIIIFIIPGLESVCVL